MGGVRTVAVGIKKIREGRKGAWVIKIFYGNRAPIGLAKLLPPTGGGMPLPQKSIAKPDGTIRRISEIRDVYSGHREQPG